MAFNEIITDDKIKELLAKIDSGDSNAKTTLGDYYNTLGLKYFSSNEEDNVEKSIYCFEESSKLNDENGKSNLATLYNQLGVNYYNGKENYSIDYKKAEDYFKKAFELGNENAKKNLGVLYIQYGKQYRDGDNAKINHELAENFFKKSIELGNEEAKYKLVKDYTNCYFNFKYGVNGYLKDIEKANQMLTKAKNTDINMVNKIADEYYNKAKNLVAGGINYDNYRKINGYLKRASKLGMTGINSDLISFYKYVGNCYSKGKKGFTKNKVKANFYMGKAGELGDADAIKKYKPGK